MKILGIIPARGGSKGIPRKNIKKLGDKILLQYTAERAYQSKLLTKVIISTDDPEIVKISKNLGFEVPFIRPSVLAQDDTPTILVIKDALEYFKETGEDFDAVCLLQPTNPFRPDGFIDNGIRQFVDTDADSLISVQEIPHRYNPRWAFEEDKQGYLKLAIGSDEIISRRQLLPRSYYRDGALYITKTQIIIDKLSLYGNKISFIISPKTCSINIDTIEDWRSAENFLLSLK